MRTQLVYSNTRVIEETDRLTLLRTLEDSTVLIIKVHKGDKIHDTLHCTKCGGCSYVYHIFNCSHGAICYCNLCYLWDKKTFTWRTEHYHKVFNLIISFVRNNKSMFTHNDLDLIDKFFAMKTNKRIRIRDFIKGGNQNVYNNK